MENPYKLQICLVMASPRPIPSEAVDLENLSKSRPSSFTSLPVLLICKKSGCRTSSMLPPLWLCLMALLNRLFKNISTKYLLMSSSHCWILAVTLSWSFSKSYWNCLILLPINSFISIFCKSGIRLFSILANSNNDWLSFDKRPTAW